MLQALKEDPPLNTKCKDKFLIQSTIITPEKEALPVNAIWSSPDVNDEGKVHQQKLRVTYLPAEGQTLEEEDENLVATASMGINNPNQYDTVRRFPGANGHPFNHLSQITPAPSQQPEERASTPTQGDVVERQSSSQTVIQDPPQVQETRTSPTPPPEADTSQLIYVDTSAELIPEPSEEDLAPEPAPLSVPAPRQVAPVPITAAPLIPAPPPEPTPAPVIITRENPVNEELYAKYNVAQLEIERLKEQVTSLSELRRRPRVPSDAGSTTASDIQTVVEEGPIHQEGVPLQVVVVIAFGVFIMTYLFF